MDKSACHDPCQDSLQRLAVTSGHEGLDHQHFHEADTQAEAILEHGLELMQAHAVDDVLVYRPALQPVQVLVPPLVRVGQERLARNPALVLDGRAADHLPVDATRRELQVVGEFEFVCRTLR